MVVGFLSKFLFFFFKKGCSEAELVGANCGGAFGTEYSKVTYVFKGLSVPLRGTVLGYEDCTQLSYETNDLGDGFGLFLRIASDATTLPWWFTGVGQKGPYALDATTLDNGFPAHEQFRHICVADIRRHLQTHARECSAWVNEGIVRYTTLDVVGVLLNPDSVKSVTRAAGFVEGCLQRQDKKGLHAYPYFFSYRNGVTLRESWDDLEAKHSGGKKGKRFKRKVKDCTELYEALWILEESKKK